MKVCDILKQAEETRFSLEVYPPKGTGSPTEPSIQQHLSRIFDTVEHLQIYQPAFVSVTYNPAGKTRATSIPIAAMIKQRYGIESVAHLTCIATPREELARTLDVIDYFEIDNILALRGDRPEGFQPGPDHLRHASGLVEEIRKHSHDFCIGVAGYPEGHPECVTPEGKRDIERDLLNFRNKVEKGASFAITQLFLDNRVYFDFVERARKVGVNIPIIPGIMTVVDYNTLGIVKGLTGASVPPLLKRKIEEHRDEPEEIMEIGIEHAIGQCKGLIDRVPCIHFYTMDMWRPVERIIQALR